MVILFNIFLVNTFVSIKGSSSLSFGVIKYWIKEDQPPGLVVGNLLDNLPYKQYIISPGYHFVLQKESEEFFSLKPGSSMLTTKKVIDLESMCSNNDCFNGTKEFQLVALVMREKQFIQELRIDIIVEDVNDNDPYFKNATYTKNIKEIIYGLGKTIDLPRAFDKDLSSINNNISYSLQNNSMYFDFNVSKDGKPVLIIKKELDAETNDTHRLTLIAWNQNYPSRPSASLDITIVIDDINDNEPRFSQSTYRVPILENVELNHQILQLRATDEDKTSKLQFIIVPTVNVEIAKTFAVSDQGMIYLIKHLDYETTPKFEIPVRVTDGEFSNNGRVEVVVIDVNDCAPQFTLNPENLVISENTPLKTLLGNIVTYDQDSTYVDNGIECRETSPNAVMKFDIIENNSERMKKINIYLNKEIDRDQINGDKRFSVIICNDMGINNKLTSTFTVTLTVLDANDNAPQFTLTDYVVRVKENLKPQYPLIHVSATDKDDGVNSQIKYFISDHLHQQYFKIDEYSGMIIGIQSLDREKQDYYQVIVVATDLAVNEVRHTSTATVHIHVIDVNDCAPKINESLNTFSVFENQPIGTIIGTLIATDCDIGQNGKFIFTLIPSAFSHYFDLLTNGSLLTKVSFDRESLSQVKFSLRITVRDIGEEIHLSSKTAVCIKILDENDNSPKISVIPDFIAAYNYSDNNTTDCSITVSKTESTNSPIFPFTYSDLDDGPNGQVTFSMRIYPANLKSNQLFYLNVTEKSIKLKRSWQQSDGNRFLITLIGRDKGVPPRETSKVIMVQFADIPPRFLDQNVLLGSFSSVKINVLIIIVLVTISTVLTTALIGAIVCMLQPCGNKRQSANCRNGTIRDNSNDNLRIKGYPDPYLVTSSIIDSVENDETEFKTQVSHVQKNDYCKSEHHWTHEIDETGRPINYYTLPPQLLACTTTTSHEEQRSDSGRGASDEDNPHYNSNTDVFQYKSLYSMIPNVAYTSMTDAMSSLTTTIPLALSKKTILSQIPMEFLSSSINNEYPLKAYGDNFSYVCTSTLPFYSISCGQNIPILQPTMTSVPESDPNIPLLNLDSYNICKEQPGFNSFSSSNAVRDSTNISYGSGTYPSKNLSKIDNFDDDMVNLSSHIDQLFFSKLPTRSQPFGKS